MKKGYYVVEVYNTCFITFWNGYRFIEEDKELSNLLEQYPIKVLRLYKEVK